MGAMRASFYCRDVTRQVAPDLAKEHERICAANDSSHDRRAAFEAMNQPKNSFDLKRSNKCGSHHPLLQLGAECDDNANGGGGGGGGGSAQHQNNSLNALGENELYVAKAYRRFLSLPSPTSAQKRDEVERHFRDAHMQAVAQHWATAFNQQRPPCPRVSFLPVWVLQRGNGNNSNNNGAATSGSSSPLVSVSGSSGSPNYHHQQQKIGSGTNNHNNNNNSGSAFAALSDNSAVTSIVAGGLFHNVDCLSVEPMLEGRFRKHNNNNGYVKTNNSVRSVVESSPSSSKRKTTNSNDKTLLAEDVPVVTSPLEMESRDAANALLHFSYKMSGRTLMVCDLQGVSNIFTDPQILTLDGVSFGRGNLGAGGMFRCIRRHVCSHVCKALGLAPIDAEEERIYLKVEERKRRGGNMAPIAQVAIPSAMFSGVAVDNDFDF